MNRFLNILAGILLAGGPLAFAGSGAQAEGLEAGEKVYKAKRCSMCHQIDGEGGKMGPDLSAVGDSRDRDWIESFLRDPKGTEPGSKHKTVKAGEEDFKALVDYMVSLKKGD